MQWSFIRAIGVGSFAVVVLSFSSASTMRAQLALWNPSQALLLEGIVVTMNEAHDVLPNGRVLIRDGRIAAVWNGPIAPEGVDLTATPRRCAQHPIDRLTASASQSKKRAVTFRSPPRDSSA